MFSGFSVSIRQGLQKEETRDDQFEKSKKQVGKNHTVASPSGAAFAQCQLVVFSGQSKRSRVCSLLD
jgi:hypothetical protein